MNIKKTCINPLYILLLLLSFCAIAFGQVKKGIDIIPVEISDVKWVHLKFPSNIKYADMGTDDISIEKCFFDNIIMKTTDCEYSSSLHSQMLR